MALSERPNRAEPWFALYVSPRREKTVDRLLSEIGYSTFLPMYRARRQWSDRVKTLDLPLFPGYVFCRLGDSHHRKAVSVPGVMSVVRCGSGNGEIPDTEIEAIRLLTRFGDGLQPWNELTVGEEVSIESGPLAGLRGLLVRTVRESRLVVSIQQIDRSVSIEVEREHVRAVKLPARRSTSAHGTSSPPQASSSKSRSVYC